MPGNDARPDPTPRHHSRIGAFFRTLPGLITAFATLLTAIVGAIVTFSGSGPATPGPDAALAPMTSADPRISSSSSNQTDQPPPVSGNEPHDTGMLTAYDGDYVNLTKGYVTNSLGLDRMDFWLDKDRDSAVIKLSGGSHFARFATIDGAAGKDTCVAALRARKDVRLDVTADTVGRWTCVQTWQGTTAAIAINRVKVAEGVIELTYVVWR